jgi:hypothetical protein
MEQNDRMEILCPKCQQRLFYSRHDLRRKRQLVYNCSECGHKETVAIDEGSALLSGLLLITVGGQRFDSENITEAIAEHSAKTLKLKFRDGDRIDVHTDRLDDDVDTLNSCGVRVTLGVQAPAEDGV